MRKTKPELQIQIQHLEEKVTKLQTEKTKLIDYIKNKKNDNIEDDCLELISGQWYKLITTFITTTSKKCGVLNVENKLVDWLDIKPSVYDKRFQSKLIGLHNSLETNDDISLISKLLCIKLFSYAYKDDEFHRLWRLLSKSF